MEEACGSDDPWCAEAKAVGAELVIGDIEELLNGWKGVEIICDVRSVVF